MSHSLETIYQFNLALFNKIDVPYQLWQHEPILDFETDVKVAKSLGWNGTHSKSLFLRIKGGGYALYLTDKDSRLDSKALKSLLGKRVSICDDQEMSQVTGCVAGAVCPFGLPQEICIVVDTKLIQARHNELLYTPGHPDKTIGFATEHLHKVLATLPNTVLWLEH
ncbi:YbaK/EbsC family protein [Vibrio sp. SCSIO 43136]|uniref:YbaK/EbsC family protein n=1 Tax=Vibrio sp. SCSIO 43136 TaxID=2819101 RepID=UPI0020760A95|nr:YbaK/EbsC family protein [Vibrio sp. SCSIO 43136]USD65633.1 YbaK/EbsC family protein [Vibrio sp. SCSIO 43136]